MRATRRSVAPPYRLHFLIREVSESHNLSTGKDVLPDTLPVIRHSEPSSYDVLTQRPFSLPGVRGDDGENVF